VICALAIMILDPSFAAVLRRFKAVQLPRDQRGNPVLDGRVLLGSSYTQPAVSVDF